MLFSLVLSSSIEKKEILLHTLCLVIISFEPVIKQYEENNLKKHYDMKKEKERIRYSTEL